MPSKTETYCGIPIVYVPNTPEGEVVFSDRATWEKPSGTRVTLDVRGGVTMTFLAKVIKDAER